MYFPTKGPSSAAEADLQRDTSATAIKIAALTVSAVIALSLVTAAGAFDKRTPVATNVTQPAAQSAGEMPLIVLEPVVIIGKRPAGAAAPANAAR
jgi:hypothetical protein